MLSATTPSSSLHVVVSELLGATLWPCWNLPLLVTVGEADRLEKGGKGWRCWDRQAQTGQSRSTWTPSPAAPLAPPGGLLEQTHPIYPGTPDGIRQTAPRGPSQGGAQPCTLLDLGGSLVTKVVLS